MKTCYQFSFIPQKGPKNHKNQTKIYLKITVSNRLFRQKKSTRAKYPISERRKIQTYAKNKKNLEFSNRFRTISKKIEKDL